MPSFTELARDGQDVRALEPAASDRREEASRTSTKLLKDAQGPVIASTDYMHALAEQIRAFVPQKFVVLGTDGFGRSDTRDKLRDFFEVDRYWVTVAALKALADEGTIERKVSPRRSRSTASIPTSPTR